MMVQCLRALGRQAEAERVAKDAILAWPRMSVLRRFFRFLGMVANEAKGLLVGLTSEGQARPEQEAGLRTGGCAGEFQRNISYDGSI